MLNKKKSSDLPPQKEEANNIDRHFNRHLADLEAEPPPNGWQNVNVRITAKTSAKGKVIDLKVVTWRKYVAVAAAVATVVVAVLLSIPFGQEINSSFEPVIAENSTDKPIESVIVAPMEQHSPVSTLLPETLNITAEKNIRPTCANVVALRTITGKPIDPTVIQRDRNENLFFVPELALIQPMANENAFDAEPVEQPIVIHNQHTGSEPQKNTLTENYVKKYPTVWAFITDKAIKHMGIKTQTDPKAKKQTYEWNTDWLSIRHTQTIDDDK